MVVETQTSEGVEETDGQRPTMGATSRTPSPQDGALPQLNSSRGVEEHRVDPALRVALDKLDSFQRSRQPAFEDFGLEHYFGGTPGSTTATHGAPSQSSATSPSGPAAAPFSLDLLMAAASSAPA